MRSHRRAGTGGKDKVGSGVMSRGTWLQLVIVGRIDEIAAEGLVAINADASESWSSC